MRVLAADDDEQVRDILARLLSRLGAEVSLAGCGEEALELFRGASREAGRGFDVAFVDLAMPWSRPRAGAARPISAGDSEGGLGLAAGIRAEEARSGRGRVRLVALTGADCSRSSDARREGFDVFLQKPVGLEELRRELAAAAP